MTNVDIGVILIASSSSQNTRLFVNVHDGPTLDSPTIFFLHGLGSSHTFYSTTLALTSQLSSKYRLISYDFDGHGLSPLSGEISIESLAQNLHDLMVHFKVEKTYGIVAHSMSGLVATTFAAKWPEKVEKLFLIGPMASLPATARKGINDRSTKVLESGLSSIVSTIAQSATSKRTKAESPLSLSLIRSLVLGTNPLAYSAACLALAKARDPDYDLIQARVCILAGEEDYLCNAEMVEKIRHGIQGVDDEVDKVEVTVVQGVGHWHAVEDPHKVAQELERWFP